MNTTLTGALSALAMLAAASAAHATVVVDFEELAHAGPLKTYAEVLSKGYRFASSVPFADAYGIYGRDDPLNKDAGGATLSTLHLLTSSVVPVNRITRADGGVFDLTSLDIESTFGVEGYTTFEFQYASGGTGIQYRYVSAIPGMQTLAFDLSGLTAFSYTTARSLQIDNVTFGGDLPPTPGGVPEPSSWALMILGFGAAGAMVRRRRVAVI